jgi:hypothetical protein
VLLNFFVIHRINTPKFLQVVDGEFLRYAAALLLIAAEKAESRELEGAARK